MKPKYGTPRTWAPINGTSKKIKPKYGTPGEIDAIIEAPRKLIPNMAQLEK